MKAIVTGKSALRLSDLTREYTFDIVEDNEIILASQVITARPKDISELLTNIIAEYQAVFEDENDLDVGDEI